MSELTDRLRAMNRWPGLAPAVAEALSEAADTIERQASTTFEVLRDRDREIARLRREIGDMTDRWHEQQRGPR